MSYDKKLPPLDEQATFGNQAPFASSAGSPSAPLSHDPYYNIPTDVPPEYSTGPSPVPETRNPQTYLPPPSAPPSGPQHPIPHHQPQQQHSPYGYLPQGQDPRQQQQQAPYFSQPPHLPSQQQQPYYGGAGPSTNYGATSNASPPFLHNNNLPPPQGYYYDNNGKPYQPVTTAPPSAPRSPHEYGGRGGRRGSVSSDSDTSSDHHHSRRSPHPRRKRKKSGNCCTCCCLTILFIFLYCWYLIKSFAFPNTSCSNTDGHETSVDTMYVPLVPGFSYKYEATEDVTGNIEVTESDTWDEKGVRILVVKRAFSKSILDKIVHTLENVNGTTVSRVHLSDTLSKDEKDKIAVGRGCLNADVHITYPRSLRAGVDSPSPNAAAAGLQQLGSLELRTITGEVSIKFKSSSPTSGTPGAYSLDSLNVVVVHGDVDVRRAVVVNKTVIAVVNGQITADLTTPGFVKADMVNGGVGLTISSTPPEGLMIMGKGDGKRVWNPENLDVQANAVNGPVGVTFRNHFHGHFALESKVGSTSFTIPANDRKMTPTNPGSNRIQGWVSEDGQEPLQALPNLVVQTAIGNIKVKVQSRDGS